MNSVPENSIPEPAQINRILQALGLPPLTRRQLVAFTTSHEDGPFVADALALSPTDVGWRKWTAAAVQRAIDAAPAPSPDQFPPQTGSQPLPNVSQQVPPPSSVGVPPSTAPRAAESSQRPRQDDASTDTRSNNVRSMQQRPNFPQSGGSKPPRSSSGEAAPSNQVQGEASTERRYDQISAYGKDVGIQFERCPNKERDCNTINISIAKATGASAKNGLDWNNKLIVMLVPQEVQLIAAVLYDLLPKCRFAGHGHDNKKWIEAERQTGQYASVRITITDKEDGRRVNIGCADIMKAQGIFMRTLKDQLGITEAAIIAGLRVAAAMYSETTAARDQSQPRQRANG